MNECLRMAVSFTRTLLTPITQINSTRIYQALRRRSRQRVLSIPMMLVCMFFAVKTAWSVPRAEFVAQTGHTNAINAIAFNADGSLLASGGRDSAIKIWDVRTGRELRALAGHLGSITSLVFSKDGKILISGGLDSTIRYWEVDSGNTTKVIRRPEPITSLALSPNGQMLASCSFGSEVVLLDLKTGEEITLLRGHTKVVNSASFSPSGRLLATASNDNTIRLWELPTGREIRVLTPPSTQTATPVVFDAATRRPMITPQQLNTDCVTSVVFSPDGNTIGSASYSLRRYDVNGIAFSTTIWETSTGRKIRTVDEYMGGGSSQFIFQPNHNSVAGSLSFAPDGKSLLATGYDYSINQWDLRSGSLIKTLPVIKFDGDRKAFHETLAKFQAIRWDPPRSPTFTPDGKTAAIVLENTILIWDVSAGKQTQYFGAHAAAITAVSFDATGTMLASASVLRPTRVWGLDSIGSAKLFKHGAYPSGAEALALSSNGNILATATLDIYRSNSHVDLWDARTGKKLRTFAGSSAENISISLDSRGKTLAIGRIDGNVCIFDTDSGRRLRAFEKTAFTSNEVELSADGLILAYAAFGHLALQVPRTQNSPLDNPNVKELIGSGPKPHVTIWNTETGTQLFTQNQEADTNFQVIALSPDGRRLATGGSKTVVWDIAAHRILRSFDSPSSTLAFDSAGTLLAAAKGPAIHVWDLDTGTEITQLTGHLGGVTSLSYSKDGARLASGSQDGSIRVWDLRKKKELLSLFALNESDYVIATPDNYYMSSRNGLAGVSFRVGDRAFPFEQFDLKYNRPDLVLTALGAASEELFNGYRSLVQERLQRLGVSAEQLGDDFHLPELHIISPGPATSTTQATARFSVRANDSELRLDRLNVYVDGVSIYGSKGINLRNRQATNLRHEVTIPLSDGPNKIQVSVVNEKGAESLAETINITYTGPSRDQRLYLLSVGVTKYRDPQNNLRYPASDARAQESFWSEQIGRFKTVISMVITDEDATAERIRAARSFLGKAGANDVVILFLAGHGVVDKDGKYYFGTSDINMGIPSQKGLSYGDIEKLLDGISARRKLVLVDTCYAGGSFQDELLRERFADLRRGTGAHIIAASRATQEAEEPNEFGSGTFTWSILDGLRGKADSNSDKQVTVSELRDYVASQVPVLSRDRQKPSVKAENLDLDFTLTRH